MDTTGKACVEFWTRAPKQGLVNANTATAVRVAVIGVLSVLENWETLDVAALDVEDLFTRFVNLRGKDFTPQSLASYKSRFNKGLSTFLSYSNNPTGWKPKAASRGRDKAATNGNGGQDNHDAGDHAGHRRALDAADTDRSHRPGRVSVPPARRSLRVPAAARRPQRR